jgi:hypothetical protein
MDAGKNLGIIRRALGVGFDDAIGYDLPRFPEYPDDIEGGARGRAREHEFHRPGAQVAAAGIRRAIEDDRVTAPRFSDEADALIPLDPCLHWRSPSSEIALVRLRGKVKRWRCGIKTRFPP